MTRRSGVTLVEVLVAIFVMGIGLIALLTLFPIGILQMAKAIRQDRCTQSAYAANSIAIMQNIRNDAYVTNFIPIIEPNPPPGFVSLFKNPSPGVLLDADDYGPSYPLFIDPYGYKAFFGTNPNQDWVAASPNYLRRRPVTFAYANNPLGIRRWFTLMDDPIFYTTEAPPVGTQPPGTPKLIVFPPPAGNYGIMRDTHFSWAYLVRRPLTSDPSIVDCSTVVFENRPISISGGSVLPETVFPSIPNGFDPGTNTITVTYAALAPNVRPGDWVYDATIVPPASPTYPYADVQSCFYRVVAVDQFAGNMVRFEVQQPLRPLRSDLTGVAKYTGTLIAMEGIAEVFPSGPARLP